MGFGLAVSVLLHAGLLAWALLNFHATPPLKLPDEIPVEVSIVSQIDLETRQKKGDSLSKIEEAMQAPGKAPAPKEAPKPKPVRAVEPPPPAAAEPPPPAPAPSEPAKAEPPKPDQIAALIEKQPPAPTPPPEPEGPSLEEKKKLEEKILEQQRQEEAKKAAEEARRKAEADAKKKAEAEAKRKADEALKKKLADDRKKRDDAKKKADDLAKKKQQEFDPAKIAELLDKSPNAGAPAQGAETPPTKPTTAKGPTAGSKTGTSDRNTARAKDMLGSILRDQFRQCWNKPLAGGGVAAPKVTLKWALNQDGTLRGQTRRVQGMGDDPVTEAAFRAAESAVLKCAPFQLPPDLYDMWREIEWYFDPQQE